MEVQNRGAGGSERGDAFAQHGQWPAVLEPCFLHPSLAPSRVGESCIVPLVLKLVHVLVTVEEGSQ